MCSVIETGMFEDAFTRDIPQKEKHLKLASTVLYMRIFFYIGFAYVRSKCDMFYGCTLQRIWAWDGIVYNLFGMHEYCAYARYASAC